MNKLSSYGWVGIGLLFDGCCLGWKKNLQFKQLIRSEKLSKLDSIHEHSYLLNNKERVNEEVN